MKQNIHFSSKSFISNSFKFVFIIMTLKMAALCLNASLETLRSLCYRSSHCLQGDLCLCFHEGSLQTVQVVVTFLVSRDIKNSPQFIVSGVEVWNPRGPIPSEDKGRNERDMIFCNQSGFRRIRSRTVLMAVSALTLFRRRDRTLSSTPHSSL